MNSKPNADIRTAIRESNLCQYQVAEKIGVSEFTFIRWMRNELSDERKQRILAAIKELSAVCLGLRNMVEVVISQKQARALAQLIYRDIHKYCEDHREEYEAFLREEQKGAGQNAVSADRQGTLSAAV